VLAKPLDELDDKEKAVREKLEDFFNENPVYQFLPTKPVVQAYLVFLFSLLASIAIWYFS